MCKVFAKCVWRSHLSLKCKSAAFHIVSDIKGESKCLYDAVINILQVNIVQNDVLFAEMKFKDLQIRY